MEAKTLIAVAFGILLPCSVADSQDRYDPAVEPAGRLGKPTPAQTLRDSQGSKPATDTASGQSPRRTPRLKPAPAPPRLSPTPAGPEAGPAPVGRTLPKLDATEGTGPSRAMATDGPIPPDAARLSMPAWLGEPPAPVPPVENRVVAAFDIEEVTITDAGLGQSGDAVFVTDVRLASANDKQSPLEKARARALLSRAEKLAGEARTIEDLTKLIDLCRDENLEFTGDKRSVFLMRRAELAPVVSWALNRRGELRSQAGDEHAAFEDFNLAVVADPHCWSALHNRGVTLATYGRLEAALIDFTNALGLNPKFAACYGNRAELLMELGRNAEAEADFTQAIAGEPENPAHHAGRASARSRQGRYAEAVQDLNRAVRLSSHKAPLLAQRGALYAEVGYYQQAVADLDAALRADAHCVAAYQSVARLLSTCRDARYRDATKAVESARRALHLAPTTDPLLLDTAAASYAADEQWEEAVRFQQQALMLAPAALQEQLHGRLELYRSRKPFRQGPVVVEEPPTR